MYRFDDTFPAFLHRLGIGIPRTHRLANRAGWRISTPDGHMAVLRWSRRCHIFAAFTLRNSAPSHVLGLCPLHSSSLPLFLRKALLSLGRHLGLLFWGYCGLPLDVGILRLNL